MIKFLKQKNNKNSGFTLVETLVAIAIFTISIIALMAVLANGISDTTYAKTKMTATYLAQEGIEYIRNMRDDYVLYSTMTESDWSGFVAEVAYYCKAGSGCGFNNSISPIPNNQIQNFLFKCSGTVPNPLDPCELYKNYGNYSVIQNGGTDSGFVRDINMIYMTSTGEIKIISTVHWKQGSGNYSVSFSENLFDLSQIPAQIPAQPTSSETLPPAQEQQAQEIPTTTQTQQEQQAPAQAMSQSQL